ncbi:MAG: TolC family protein [Cyanobacteria bacterium J06638_38]
MGKKNRLVKLVSLGTALAISNITIANADQTPIASSNGYYSTNVKDIKSGKTSALLTNAHAQSPSVYKGVRVAAHSALTAGSIKQNPKHNTVSGLIPQRIAQAELNIPDNVSPGSVSPEIIKPAQEPIPSTEKLDPSGNPLSFPTQPSEVRVDLQQPITLEQAIELSLNNNREIEQARLAIESAEAALRQEKAALFPTFGLSTGFDFSDSAFLDSNLQQIIDDAVAEGGTEEAAADSISSATASSAEDSSFTYNGGLTLNYNIFTGGLRGASIRTAEKQLTTAELDLEITVEEARLETSSNYYNLQNADAQVAIQQAAVEDASQTLKDAQLLERAGLGTRFDVLRAEVELSQAQQSLNTAIANQNIARRQLAETLSVSHDTDLSTADAIEAAGAWEMPLPETIVLAFQNRAELEQFLLQKEISEEARTIALSSIRPSVSANAGYSTSDDFEDDFDISDSFNVGVSLQWTLFDGGAARAGARQAETDAEIAETLFADQRNQIRFAVEQAFFQLEANLSNIGTATKEVELAEESLRLARLRFQAGVGTQTDVIEAQTQLTTARGALLSSITDYNLSYVSLQREVSNFPDNGLQDLP